MITILWISIGLVLSFLVGYMFGERIGKVKAVLEESKVLEKMPKNVVLEYFRAYGKLVGRKADDLEEDIKSVEEAYDKREKK